MLKATGNKLRPLVEVEDDMPLVTVDGGRGGGGVQKVGTGICRTVSCGEDHQKSALIALKSGDLRLLSDILSDEGTKVNPNKEYLEENYNTLLSLAVELGNKEAVRILIKGGARPDHLLSVRKLTVLHLVAAKSDPLLMKMMIHMDKIQLDVVDNQGRTPLHRACSGLGKKSGSLDCVKLLISGGCSLDIPDQKGGQTPLYIAANSGYFDGVKFLIDGGANFCIECQGEKIVDVIKEKFTRSQVGQLNLERRREGKVALNLFDLLDLAEQEGEKMNVWSEAVEMLTAKELDKDNGVRTLCQLCTERGLSNYLSVLLDHGADPNKVTKHEGRSPLLLAAAAGNPLLLSVLLGHNKKKSPHPVDLKSVDQETGGTVLHQVLRKPKYDLGLNQTRRQNTDYQACLSQLLDIGPLMERVVNNVDLLGNTALHYAVQFWDQDTVTSLLRMGANIGIKNIGGETPISNILPDTMEQFLDTHCIVPEGNPTNENFKITFKYDFLAPSKETDDKLDEEGGDIGKIPKPETEVLWYMARSKDHRHLLKHPVITSFLDLKWGRISGKYNANITFFLAFVVSLTLYIFSNYGGHSLGVTPPSCPPSADAPQHLWWTVVVLLAVMILREFLQFSINPSRYLSSVENIFEVILISTTSSMLFISSPGCDIITKRELASASLFLAWAELVTMIGRHPMLSSYNTYLTMFYRVLKTFLLFLAWYSLFIIAFGLGFYILLHKDVPDVPKQEYHYFDSLDLTLIKTFTMFVGELEFSNLPLDTHFSRIFFLIFLFLIVVVMMNLLNGLAVSDTGIIRDEAEIHGHICRVEAISALEATLLGDPSLLWRGPRWLSFLIPSCGLRQRLGAALGIRTLFSKLTGSSGVLLFYTSLPDKRLVIHPNRKYITCSDCSHPTKDVGVDVLKSSKQLILRLSARQITSTDIKLDQLTRQHNKLEEAQTRLEDKMDQILNCLESMKTVINKM